MTRHVICPVALHPDGAPLRIPAFKHPKSGLQIIKDDFQQPAHAAHTAAQTLFNVSSLETRNALLIGQSENIQTDTIWHFALCRLAPPVRRAWQHLNRDDKTLLKFQWIEVSNPPLLHDIDTSALSWMEKTL
jgi:hypothetical protein